MKKIVKVLTEDYNPFPVGSIYMSVNNINPKKYFGGTWVAWGSGRIPIGVKTSDTDFATVEKTGGSKTHKLTVNEIPSHTHTFTGSSVTTASAGSHTHQVGVGAYTSAPTVSSGLSILGEPENLDKRKTTSAGSHTHTVTAKGSNSSTGGSQAFDIMNPYITCYMWKRTA